MPFAATVLRVLIASPSDLRSERDLVERAIHRWNAVQSAYAGVVLLPVRWEINATAEMGAPAQHIINRQIVDDSDVLIDVFWTRLGTPTATTRAGQRKNSADSSMRRSPPPYTSRGYQPTRSHSIKTS